MLEGADTIGGGCRSAELTLPGFVHDICSTVHALALGSPFLRTLPLADHGLELVHPDVPARPPARRRHGGGARALRRGTARGLGADERAYRKLFGPLVAHADELTSEILGPLRLPRHPLVLARFGPKALRSAQGWRARASTGERARALLAGCSAHSMLSLRRRPARPSGWCSC